MKNYTVKRLKESATDSRKRFNERLIATQHPILGVKMAPIRSLAKEAANHPGLLFYLEQANLHYFEEYLLYGLTLSHLKDQKLILNYLDPLIRRFDNWAEVDAIIPSFKKLFNNNPLDILNHFLPLKEHKGEFTKRSFIVLLLSYYLTDEHHKRALKLLTEIKEGQYYVDMALAWTLCEGLIKQWDSTLPLLLERRFTKFVQNKTISKARDSFRVNQERKEYLKTLRL